MQFAQISAEEGSISDHEAEMVTNVLKLNDLTAREVMTPRTVVFHLPATMTLGEVRDHVDEWHYSRIPIFDPESTPGHVLLHRFIAERTHLFAVVDEVDKEADLRAAKRTRGRYDVPRGRRRGLIRRSGSFRLRLRPNGVLGDGVRRVCGHPRNGYPEVASCREVHMIPWP
jgi:hypothetical protein